MRDSVTVCQSINSRRSAYPAPKPLSMTSLSTQTAPKMIPSPDHRRKSRSLRLQETGIIAVTVLTILLTPASLLLAADQQASQTDRLEKLRGQIKTIEQGQTQNQQQQSQLNRQLSELETSINKLGKSLAVLQRTHRAEQVQIRELENLLAGQQARLAKHKTLLAHLVRRTYLNGQQEYVKLLLNQQNPADIQRMLNYYGYLQQAHVTEITDLKTVIDELETTQEQLVNSKRVAAATLETITQQHDSLASRRSDQARVLARLVSDYQDNESQLAEMRKDEARLTTLVSRLQEVLTDIPNTAGQAFSSSRGTLSWPARGPIKHQFGQRKKETGMRWQGVLIDTPESSDVEAVHAGQVAFADWLRGFGLLVIIDHGENYMTVYGHNQALLVDSGSWVKQGDIIATAGTGGGETESGLYFEIRDQGTPINPANWCQAKL